LSSLCTTVTTVPSLEESGEEEEEEEEELKSDSKLIVGYLLSPIAHLVAQSQPPAAKNLNTNNYYYFTC